MGTRADFYVGVGAKAEWLGSVAWDGYKWEQDPASPLMAASTEEAFRAAVESILTKREGATRPEQGWPWPWKTSATTDYTYAFDGNKTRAFHFDKKHAWPDMSDRENVAFGNRSGVLIVGIPARRA